MKKKKLIRTFIEWYWSDLYMKIVEGKEMPQNPNREIANLFFIYLKNKKK